MGTTTLPTSHPMKRRIPRDHTHTFKTLAFPSCRRGLVSTHVTGYCQCQHPREAVLPRWRTTRRSCLHTRVTPCLLKNVTSKHPLISDSITDSIIVPKQKYSIQVPYNHIRHRRPSLEFASTICLLFHKTLGPMWHWLLLSSLQIEPTSGASKRIIHQIPSLLKIISSLHSIAAISNLMLLLSVSCIACTTVMIAWQCDIRNRASIFVLTIMLLALGGFRWHSSGGSVAEFFLLYMPLAVSIGFSLGLLLRDETTQAHKSLLVDDEGLRAFLMPSTSR